MTALRQLGQRLFGATLENDARWWAFVAAAVDLIGLVRTGSVDRQEAGSALEDWRHRYFDTNDNRTGWLTRAVVIAFARATAPKIRRAA
jgi:hypothetical protein